MMKRSLWPIILALAITPNSNASGGEGMVCDSTGGEEGGVCTSSNSSNDDQQQQHTQRKQLEELELEIAPTAEEEALCVDQHESCAFWASLGECEANPAYMLEFCQKSCKTCPQAGEKKGDPNILIHKNEWGVPQELLKGEAGKYNDMGIRSYNYSQVYELLQQTQHYMTNEVFVEEKYKTIRSICQNKHKSCTFWAVVGECEKNIPYMSKSCAPACQTCELLDFNVRCPVDDDATLVEKSIWKKPGDLDTMFLNILNDPYYQQYEPVIYSKPNYIRILIEDADKKKKMNLTEDSNTVSITGGSTIGAQQRNQLDVPIIQNGPWVVTLENFLTEEECDTLVKLGGDRGYERSVDVGAERLDGTHEDDINSGRTSTNAWCLNACYDHPTTQQVISKMTNVTGIPDTNAEYLQLLKYEETQFYQQHHDYIQYSRKRQEGVRILTLFMYLNDVDKGGGTNFPLLDLTIMPKKGKALLWPSVLNDDPGKKDGRTDHQALPVDQGRKYGANAWFHLRSFKDSYARGCAG